LSVSQAPHGHAVEDLVASSSPETLTTVKTSWPAAISSFATIMAEIGPPPSMKGGKAAQAIKIRMLSGPVLVTAWLLSRPVPRAGIPGAS
jgi:hypothetical protein